MKILSLLLCVILLTASIIFAADSSSSSPDCEPTFTAIFGSCNKHNLDQSYWNKLLQKVRQLNNDKEKKQNQKPSCNNKVSDKKEIDVISWLGDVIYSDYQTLPVGSHFTRVNETEMANRWHTMKNHQEYQNILKVTRTVNGLYDDHDMGLNDAGKELDIKKVSQNHLLDFIDVPKAGESKEATVRRNRDGVYAFHKYPIKLSDTASAGNVCFLMIDARTHRDHPRPDGKGDMLGEEQWKWIETVLKTGRDPEIEEEKSDNKNIDGSIRNIDDVCAVTFLSTGVQVIADSQPMENWGEFPETRDRLLRLLQKSGASKFIILSGDTHMAELNKLSATKIPLGQNQQQEQETELYNKCGESPFEYNHLYEVTSSGLTHHVHPLFGSPDRFDSWFPSHRRVGQMYPLENAGIITVKCRGLDTRTCDVNVYVVAIPDPSLPWDDKTSMSEIIHLNVNFALDSAELMRHQLQTLVSDEERKECASLLDFGGKKGTYKLPVYYAPWTQAMMLTKKLIPYFEEETRLHIIFFHMWVLIGCLTIVLRIIWSCLCGGRRRNKTQKTTGDQKQKKE